MTKKPNSCQFTNSPPPFAPFAPSSSLQVRYHDPSHRVITDVGPLSVNMEREHERIERYLAYLELEEERAHGAALESDDDEFDDDDDDSDEDPLPDVDDDLEPRLERLLDLHRAHPALAAPVDAEFELDADLQGLELEAEIQESAAAADLADDGAAEADEEPAEVDNEAPSEDDQELDGKDRTSEENAIVKAGKKALKERNDRLAKYDRSIFVTREKQVCLCRRRNEDGPRFRLYLQVEQGAPFRPGFNARVDRVLQQHKAHRNRIFMLGYIGDLLASHGCASQLLAQAEYGNLLQHIARPSRRMRFRWPENPAPRPDIPCNASQLAALRGIRHDVEVIQGPPGTGKSTMIAHIVTALTAENDTVLCTAIQVSLVRENATVHR